MDYTLTMREYLENLAGMDEATLERLSKELAELLDQPVQDAEAQQEEILEVFNQWRQIDANIKGVRRVLEVGSW